MAFLRLHRRLSAWLAMLALVLGALAPTVTQAMVSGGERDGWLQICSVSGMVWVKADAATPDDQAPASNAPQGNTSQPCAWCTLHGGMAGLPAADQLSTLPAQPTELPPAFFFAPPAATVWLPAQSRAPPLAS